MYFFDVICELFLNSIGAIKENEGDYLEIAQLIEVSDSNFKSFFKRFFNIQEGKGFTNNNQMF